jgi:hypothetical protein
MEAEDNKGISVKNNQNQKQTHEVSAVFLLFTNLLKL